MPVHANDNRRQLIASIDHAIAGQALSLDQPHRRFGRCYAEFIRHAGDGKHICAFAERSFDDRAADTPAASDHDDILTLQRSHGSPRFSGPDNSGACR